MTEPEQWAAVDRYIETLLLGDDATLDSALQRSESAGLPAIQVTPMQGKLLHLLARSIGASRILEIGTLAGYSAIWLARALPSDGRLVTLEINPTHAEVARANLAEAGLAERVDLRVAPALSSLKKLAEDHSEPFDFVFIDADKANTDEYFAYALDLVRVGALIVVDNVVRDGRVADPAYSDSDVEGIRRFHGRLASERRVSATEIQTVGGKGYDGFALALVLSADR